MICAIPFERRDWKGRKRFYLHLVAANGEVLLASEAYNRRIDRERAIDRITEGPIVRVVKP